MANHCIYTSELVNLAHVKLECVFGQGYAMSKFTNRSFIKMFLLTVCTLGLYWLYWDVSTKRELVRAGGQVPNAFLVILPIFNLYFWYKYAEAYVKMVKGSRSSTDLLICFFIPTFGGYMASIALSFLAKSSEFLSTQYVLGRYFELNGLFFVGLDLYLLNALASTIITYLVFQKGYNEQQS